MCKLKSVIYLMLKIGFIYIIKSFIVKIGILYFYNITIVVITTLNNRVLLQIKGLDG